MRTKAIVLVISIVILISMTSIATADTLVINSDSTWKVNQNSVSGWETVAFNDSGWLSPQVIGAPPMSPWGTIPGMNPTGAKWIWTREGTNAWVTPDISNVDRYFRKEFVIPGNPTAGNVRITVDNEYVIYVNGVLIGSNNDWYAAETYDIRSNLHQGKNLIAVCGKDWGGPEGLLLDSTITYSNQIPEFPTIAIPVISIIGLMLVLNRKKQ